jgi:hypothetical protein
MSRRWPFRQVGVLAGTLLVLACDTAAPPPPPVAIVVAGAIPARATVGTLAASPQIQIQDAEGRPRAGIAFTVTVTDGGSVADVASRTTQGSTTVGRWTLGTTTGVQALTVTSGELPALTITITADADVPAIAVADVPTTPVTGRPSTVATVVPTIRVRDAFGNAVPGVSVAVELLGGGSVADPSPVTNANGVASTGPWTLRSTAGVNEVRLRVGTLAPVTFRAIVENPYAVSLRYVGTPPSETIQAAFRAAVARIESVIVGDLTPIPFAAFDYASECDLPGAPVVDEVVDDLIIFVAVQPIDGVGNILGQAGPCMVRGGSRLPVLGDMILDVADLNALAASGNLQTVILHEMLHVIGIGTIWGPAPNLGLTSGTGGPNPTFLGVQAREQYLALGGNAALPGVPLENTGGAGTRDGHWRESIFGRELMTGFLNAGVLNPLSTITIGALADFGYAVDFTVADLYLVSPAFRVAQQAGPAVRVPHTVLRGPRAAVSPRGVRTEEFAPNRGG